VRGGPVDGSSAPCPPSLGRERAAITRAAPKRLPRQTPMLWPIPNRRKIVEKVSVGEAARRLGISVDTVRRRISKGELLAHREPTPQGFRWEIELGPNDQPLNSHEGNNELLVTILREELDARRREIEQLHVLLGQAQAQTALAAPERRSWWRRWW